MIWNAKAVNRSSKCNPGSQTVWFEKSLTDLLASALAVGRELAVFSQRKTRVKVALWRIPVKLARLIADTAKLRLQLAEQCKSLRLGFRHARYLTAKYAAPLT